MKNQQTMKRGALCAAPVGLAGSAGRMLAGAVALLLVSGAFGGRAWAIIGGEPDGNHHPNVGAVIFYDSAVGGVTCASGTLIHPRVLLTAGHVIDMIESGRVVLLGVSFEQEISPEDSRTWLEVSEIVGTFTGATASPRDIDIGAIILRRPVRKLTPEPLPAEGFLESLKNAGQLLAGAEGTRFTVVGYGMRVDWPPPEPSWWADECPQRNAAESGYLGLNVGWLFLNQNLAAGYGGTTTGDSGGPTFWTDPETGEEVLVSVSSWGDINCIAHGLAYRIDTAESLGFIQDVIDSLEQ